MQGITYSFEDLQWTWKVCVSLGGYKVELLLVIVGMVIDIICYVIYVFRNSTLMSILPMVHEGVR